MSGAGERALAAMCVLGTLAVFVTDLFTPLGFAHGILYPPLVLVAVLTHRQRLVIALTVAGAVLTVVGAFLSPPPISGLSLSLVTFNRLLAVLAIVLSGVLAVAWMRLAATLQGSGDALRQANDALREQDARTRESLREMRDLAEAMPMTVWRADVHGRVDYISRAFVTYTGVSHDKLVSGDWFDHVHPDDREPLTEGWRAARHRGEPYEVEFRLRRTDGAWRWHLTRAVPVRGPDGEVRTWYGSSMDIDDQKRLQDEAKRLAHRLETTLESITDALLTVDLQWTLTYANGQAERLLQRSRDDLLGRVIWDVYPDAVGTRFQREYERAMRDGVAVRFDDYYEPLGKHFEVAAFPSAEGLAIFFRDVTEQRALAAQLHQVQKLESLGHLTGGVAHDFNNLLTVILGNAELLAEHLHGQGRQRVLAEMIANAAHRGAEMTQRLLAFARKQALQPQVVDLNRLVAGIDPLLRRTLGEHIEIELVRAGGLWPALVDPGQIENALLNLAVNARDAMPSGGRLTIETANVRLDQAYASQHADVPAGQYAMLAVSDTGTGIPPEHMSRLFEPFFTTKGVGKGTGLGLPMVYGLVKQLNGHVAVYSELGRGTTVKLYLPRHRGGASESEPVAPAPPERVGQGELVLLVEDDELVRSYVCGQLHELGYSVLEAGDGPSALELLRARPDIALLFTDIVMPGGMSGRELADAARALRPELPVLYTSGYTENAIVHHGRLDPGVILLGKPYRRAELAQKLREALQRNGT